MGMRAAHKGRIGLVRLDNIIGVTAPPGDEALVLDTFDACPNSLITHISTLPDYIFDAPSAMALTML